jgi:hypothetical protein
MHLSDIGINVYLNTIQGALESFLSSNGPRIFPLQYQNLVQELASPVNVRMPID